VRLAVDSYNRTSLAEGAGQNGHASGRDASGRGGTGGRFVVEEVTHVGDHVITTGTLVGLGSGIAPPSTRLILLWEFDSAGSVTDIRAFASGPDPPAASGDGPAAG